MRRTTKATSQPTPRAWTLVVAAVVLYFFANQTQVGWMYLMAAVMAACVAAARALNRGALRGLHGARHVRVVESAAAPSTSGPTARLPDAFHVGDEVEVVLTLYARGETAQVTLVERCPLNAGDTSERGEQTLYLPWLMRGQQCEYAYAAHVARRGVVEFPPLALHSFAPFGIFQRSGTLHAPYPLLVYPEIIPLARLDLLDRRADAYEARAVAGHGLEVIGARPYRPGDSPRHIHWRSTARTGQLISKEMADDAQPSLALALDCADHGGASAPRAFELAVTIAASLGEYALRQGWRVELLMQDAAGKRDAVTWHALLERLARVQPTSTHPLSEALRVRPGAFLAVVLPTPDLRVCAALAALRAGGTRVLAVVVETDVMTRGTAQAMASSLASAGIDARVARPEGWQETLAARQTVHARAPEGA